MQRAKLIHKSVCTTAEAAELLGVSVRTAQNWAEAGLLQAWKTPGGHRRIARDAVARLAADIRGKHLTLRGPGHAPSATTLPSPTLTVLIVATDPDLRQRYAHQFELWPVHPRTIFCSNGIEALLRIGLERPHLFITELETPDMNGVRMLRQIAAMPELAGMTTVATSELSDGELRQRGGVPEGIPVLPKPIQFDRILDIARIIQDRRTRAGKPAST